MSYAKAVVAGSSFTLVLWTGIAEAQWLPAPAPAPAQTAPTAPAASPAPAPAASAPPATTPAAGTEGGAATNPDLGDPGAFVIDQISGFRGRVGGGVSYYGPLGIAYNTFSSPSSPTINATGGSFSVATTDTTIKSWSIWLAPSIDYFFAKNISIGGLFAIDTTFGSSETKTTKTTSGGSTTTTDSGDLPSVVSFTLMPRVGYLARMNDRLSFWPRLGIGYFSGTNVSVNVSTNRDTGATSRTETTINVHSLLFQLDIGIIYQITDNVFFRAAPAVTFSTNGSGSVKYKTVGATTAGATSDDSSGSGSAFQFELTSGFGANFSL